MNIGYIYKITCLINNRVYVGSKLSEKFINSYWSSSKNPEYWEDLQLYGKDNFKREILYWCKTKEELREKEREFILSEKALVSEGGYNQALGANSVIFTDAVRNKMRISAKKRWNKMTEEEKLAYGEKRRQLALDPNGTMQSAEYKEKMKMASSGWKLYTNGKINIRSKNGCPDGFKPGTCNPNRHISREMTYEAREKLSNARKGKMKNCHWWNNGIEQKFCKECPGEDWIMGRLPMNVTKPMKFHKCCCIEENITFDSIRKAAEWLNVIDKSLEDIMFKIRLCCNGKLSTAYHHHWKYVD